MCNNISIEREEEEEKNNKTTTTTTTAIKVFEKGFKNGESQFISFCKWSVFMDIIITGVEGG